MELEPLLPSTTERFVDAFHDGRLEDARALLPELHAADLAGIFELLAPDERPELVKLVPENEFAEFIHQLPVGEAVTTLLAMPPEPLVQMLSEIPDDTLVDLLQEMNQDDRGRAFHLLSEDRRKAARRLLRFPDDSAGGRMTTAFATVRENMTVAEAIETLRHMQEETEVLARIYVVNEEGVVLGKVRLRDLTFAPPQTLISEINDDDTRAVLATADQEKAVRMMAKYDMLSLPVVDEEGRLLGLITHDDALDIQEQESTEDLERQSGISGETTDDSYLNTPVLRHVRRRFGWIVSLAFMGLASGFLVYKYNAELSKWRAISIYMPMIVAAGGNTGGQAATMVIRAMSLGELEVTQALRVAWRELRVGLIIGLLVAGFMGLQIHFLLPSEVSTPSPSQPWLFPVVIMAALLAQITTSTLIGAILPIGAKAARLDPAVIASPVITTLVDATGLVILFNLAMGFLG
jgi:magnesium transporter